MVPIDAAVPGPCAEVWCTAIWVEVNGGPLLDVDEKVACIKVVCSTYIVGSSTVIVKDP